MVHTFPGTMQKTMRIMNSRNGYEITFKNILLNKKKQSVKKVYTVYFFVFKKKGKISVYIFCLFLLQNKNKNKHKEKQKTMKLVTYWS